MEKEVQDPVILKGEQVEVGDVDSKVGAHGNTQHLAVGGVPKAHKGVVNEQGQGSAGSVQAQDVVLPMPGVAAMVRLVAV